MQLKVLSVLYGVLINPYWGDRLGTAGVIELVVDNVRRHAFKMDFAIIGCAVVVAAGMDRNCQAVERFVAAGCIDCIVATITRYLYAPMALHATTCMLMNKLTTYEESRTSI